MPTIDETVISKVRTFFLQQGLDLTKKIGLAFSGGSDSLGLLAVLVRLCTQQQVVALYVNHHLRSEEELNEEQARNQANCDKLGVKLVVLDLGPDTVVSLAQRRKAGVEDAARTLRYEALYNACEAFSCRYLATAHTLDDQLETLLLRLFQASSIASLQGAFPCQEVKGHSVVLIRPTLYCTHQELQDFVQSQGYGWSEDSTNADTRYLRNAIRSRLKKPILELFPHAYDAVATMQQRFSDVSRYLDAAVNEAMLQIAATDEAIEFSLDWYQGLGEAIKELVLYRIVAHVQHEDAARIRKAVIERIRSELKASNIKSRWIIESSYLSVRLEKGLCRFFSQSTIWSFCRPLENPSVKQDLVLADGIGFSVGELAEDADAALLRLDAFQLDHPVIRSMQLGDCIVLENGTVSVSKLLSSYKIPASQVPSVPVLADRSGVVAVFARQFGGRDRLAKRFKAPLARRLTNIYSSNKRNDCSETEKRQPRFRTGTEA